MPLLLTSNQVRQIVQEIQSSAHPLPVEVDGIADSFKAFLIGSLFKETGRSLLIVTPTSEEADKLIGNLHFFLSFLGVVQEIDYFPSLEIIPYEQVDPPPGLISERTKTLRHLSQTEPGSRHLVITTVQALMAHLPSTEDFKKASLTLRQFDACPKDDLLEKLIDLGFDSASMVENPGEFSHRGGILDFWPVERDLPVRLEFDGELIESLRSFNPFDQKSVAPHETVELWPVLNKKREGLKKETTSLFSYFKENRLLILDEPNKIEKEFLEFEAEILEYYAQALDRREEVKSPQQLYHSAKGLLQEMEKWPSVHCSGLQFETKNRRRKK
ncbi:MAG: hypothetical protein HY202_09175, partial [Nitrospirae bacterium]|nr:hypothetical protein [Nitrospirota bacterium]